jgi:hypothetical protein
VKKLLVLFVVIGLVIGLSASALASYGLGYGFFETKENNSEVDGLIITTEGDFGSGYNFEMRNFLGNGEGNYENNLLDLRLYKKINSQNNTDFYLGGGWKWLTEDSSFQGYAATSSQWGLPVSAKMKINSDNGFTFGAKADYWFFGSYNVDSNFTTDVEGDFSGFGFDIYGEKTITKNISVRLGYMNEDYTFGEDESAGVSEFDNGFSGVYFSGQYIY